MGRWVNSCHFMSVFCVNRLLTRFISEYSSLAFYMYDMCAANKFRYGPEDINRKSK
jgi:hypothetical protein